MKRPVAPISSSALSDHRTVWTRAALVVIAAAVGAIACRPQPTETTSRPAPPKFSPTILKVQDNQRINKARGQVLYIPVYSNIPYLEEGRSYDLGGLLTVHNTDLERSITVSQVLYFHNDGHLVKDYLNQRPVVLRPLESTKFFVPENDKSGTGANFLVEWQADVVVNAALAEVVMISLSSGRGVSFASTGKVIREDR